MTAQEYEDALASLRWREDMLITNHFGERVWLRACFHGKKRIGITDCCPAEAPCPWHAALAKGGSRIEVGAISLKTEKDHGV